MKARYRRGHGRPPLSSFLPTLRSIVSSVSLALRLSRTLIFAVCYSFPEHSRGSLVSVHAGHRRRNRTRGKEGPLFPSSRPGNPPGHYLKRSPSEATKCHRYLSRWPPSSTLWRPLPFDPHRFVVSWYAFRDRAKRSLPSVSLLKRRGKCSRTMTFACFPETKRRARMIARKKTEKPRLLLILAF